MDELKLQELMRLDESELLEFKVIRLNLKS